MRERSTPLPLGGLIKAKRLADGETQEVVAEAVGSTQPNVNRWENLLTVPEPDRELHARIREYLGIGEEEYYQAQVEQSYRVRERRQ